MAYDPMTGQMNFGYSQPSYVTPTTPSMNFGTATQPYGMGTASMNNMNMYGQPQTNPLTNNLGFGYDPAMAGATTDTGLFGNVSGSDWLNFGTNVAGLGAGIYYQNQALDQQQQQLDLARDKYNTYQQEQKDLDNAYANFT